MKGIGPMRLALRTLHNGKGRPVSLHTTQRSFSQISSRVRPLTSNPIIGLKHLRLRHCDLLQSTFPAIKHASTASGADTAVATNPPVNTAVPTNAWETPLDFGAEAPFSLEPHIGYLKELGIEFGWGPTSLVQWFLEHVWVYSGLPWVGAVVLSAVLVRTALLKFFVDASDTGARLATVSPHLKWHREKLKEAQLNRDTPAMMAAIEEQRAIYKKAGIKFRRIWVPTLLQAPIGYGTFVLTRRMAELPVPGLDTGGFLWLTDLTVADPTYILPVAASGLTYLTFKYGGETGVVSQEQKATMETMKVIMPSLFFLFMIWFPGLTQIGFFTTTVLSWMQSTIFRNRAWRERLGLHPFPRDPEPAASGSGPYKGTLNRYQPFSPDKPVTRGPWARMKAKVNDYMAQRQKKEGRLSKRELNRAESYEQQRRNEIEADIVDQERRRELRR